MRQLIHSTIQDVSRKDNIAYKTIQVIVNRQVDIEVNWDKVENIDTIGIDEISLRKGHSLYVTIISAKTKAGKLYIIAVIPGRSKDSVKSFLKAIPENIRCNIKSVCTDMYEDYVNAAIEVFGVQALIIDRYHVAKLYRKPLDELRIKEMARLKNELDKEAYAKLEGMMWILRRKHECLSEDEKDKLQLLYHYSPILKKAYKQALKLTQIFNTHCSRKSAMAKVKRWIRSTKKDELSYFKSFVKTLEKYLPYIANYFKNRKNSGFVEGLNNKVKVAKRRCYGLFKTTTLFQRLFLDFQGHEFYA